MEIRDLRPEGREALEQALGYLNFSSGAPDAQFLGNFNLLYGELALWRQKNASSAPLWTAMQRLLRAGLDEFASQAAFRDSHQAVAVIALLFEQTLPGYRQFHRDLLFHLTDEELFQPFFVGRAAEATLREGGPWEEGERIVAGAITRLNDYLGHRPVATLESQKIEPYRHEWVRPIPLYIRGAGVAFGRYHNVVEKALELLRETDEDLLHSSHFSFDLLDELAFDPRAYDFDHPVNKRPNYHFGQWDPHQIDNQGRYRRFVVQQVTLDALMHRYETALEIPHDERLFEAAAVLAGTMLMAAGVSGRGPGAHDSTITLGTLLPQIAANRDTFYERLFSRLSGPHGERLKKESDDLRQPFGGARQHLNSQLARRRATQLEHVHLARIFAQMGFAEAAREEAHVAPAASARMQCQIDCLLTDGNLAVDQGRLAEAAATLPQVIDLLHRAIECGAIIDPWNILGFDANFSLFPSLENSIRDHRADELVDLMEQIFALYSRVWNEAAARDDQALAEEISRQFRSTADWWRRFATHEVSSVETMDALEIHRAAERVAESLRLWHKGGAAAGDVRFWAPHASMFDSPKAYSLVIEALLARDDYVASMALLVHWLSQAETIGLERGDSSFPELAELWLSDLRQSAKHAGEGTTPPLAESPWKLVRKFLDYLEANAEAFGEIPRFEIAAPAESEEWPEDATSEEEDDEEEESLFGAAYEDVVYTDSTADGVEGEIFDPSDATYDIWESESRRLGERLAFHSCRARLWRLAAMISAEAKENDESRLRTLAAWAEQAESSRRGLLELLRQAHAHRIPRPSGDHDSMIDYDRQRIVKESLLERIIAACVEMADAARSLLAGSAAAKGTGAGASPEVESLEDDQRHVIALQGALLRGDAAQARQVSNQVLTALAKKPLLYVPLAKGGDPGQIVAARIRQAAIAELLAWLPKAGLIRQTCLLIEAAREMERNNPVGPGAVTEFDELYKVGYRALVESLIDAAEAEKPGAGGHSSDTLLVNCLEDLTKSLLQSWMHHSQTLRLSVLERVQDEREWRALVAFIRRYGGDLFTQRFLNLGNIRAILHQGVGEWLDQLREDLPADESFRLLDDLDGALPREEAIERLSLVLEAIVENYGEYRDYNSTTTQSDRGEMLYMLLDFLRLRCHYDRVAWNLKPVVVAHEILVRRGWHGAAEMWRQGLVGEINDQARQFLSRLAILQRQYAMKMPTVADRLNERFVRPLVIDRVRALVAPAIDEARRPPPWPIFEALRNETEELAREPSGVGLDVPVWLAALEDEVEMCLHPERQEIESLEPPFKGPKLTLDQVRGQIERWQRENKR